MLCRPPMSCLRCPIQRVFAAIAMLAFGAELFAQEQTLKVLCYNIHHGEGVDGKVDLIRQAEVIKSCSPDLVALQEVDDKTERTGRIDQTAILAELTGLNGRFVHQLDFEGGRYGQAILSKFPISEVTLHWLPGMPDRERRIAGAVVVQVNDLKLTFVTTHLHHNNESFRQQQSLQLNQVFAKHAETLGLPMILAGAGIAGGRVLDIGGKSQADIFHTLALKMRADQSANSIAYRNWGGTVVAGL